MSQSSRNGSRPSTVLLVEGNPGDARLVEEVCRDMALEDRLHIVSSGSDALDFVNRRGEYADAPQTNLIILDWHLPNTEGEAVLEELNDDPAHTHLPVIVVSGLLSERELRRVYEMDANACITKPTGPDELEDVIRSIETFWLSTARLPGTDGKRQ
ncbi:response regulator [Natrialbaceae archaeon GCM10025810]|uniref:response regulator n=1 Tax=Halovalidus salilacus TaxID=3075124 RepID=UPI003607220F